MSQYDEIKQYCQTVCEQIRWKKVHPLVFEEIDHHICDQRDAYMEEGDSPETATHKAVLQMGDAVDVGVALDQSHRPKAQWPLLAVSALFLAIGFLSNYFVTQFFIPEIGNNFFQNIFWYLIALGILLVCYFIDFTFLGKYAFVCYAAIIILSIIGLFFGPRVGGSIFLRVGRFSLSMASMLSVYPLLFALLIYVFRSKGYMGILLCELAYLPLAFILLTSISMMGFLLFSLSALLLLLLAVLKGWFPVERKHGLCLVFLPAFTAIAILILCVTQSPYYSQRLNAILDPYSVKEEAGYWYINIRNMLKNSRLIGEGILPGDLNGGNGYYNYTFRTDYILTALTFRFGWIVSAGVLAVITLFSYLGFSGVKKQKSVLGTLVSASIMISFVLHSIFYIIGNLGFGTSALPLPLISYGNTALLLNAGLIGFMLSVFRTGEIYHDKLTTPKYPSRIQYEDGKLVINLNPAHKIH